MIDRIKSLIESGSIRGNAIQIYYLQLFTIGLGLVGSIIVARTLGPAQKGIVDLFNLLNSFILDIGLLGFGSGLLYYLVNKNRPLEEVHGTGLFFSLVVGLLTIAIGFLGIIVWRRVFPGLNDWIILLSFILAPFTYYRLIWTNVMTGLNQAVAVYRVGFYFALFNLLLILGLWMIHWLTFEKIIILGATITVVGAIISFGIIFDKEPKIKPSLILARETLAYGIVIWVGFIANVLHFKVDQVMINYWIGPSAVGIYAVSVRWAETLFLLDNALISASLYKISSLSSEESYTLTKRIFKTQLLISGAAGIILAILAYPMIIFLYGEAYLGATLPLVLLIPGTIAWSVAKVMSVMLVYKSSLASYATKVAIMGTLTNVLLNYLLLKIMGIGIIGASIASSVSYTLVALLTGFKARNLRGNIATNEVREH